MRAKKAVNRTARKGWPIHCFALKLNCEMMIPENDPVGLLSAQLEELDYRKLYEAYSSVGRKSAADPWVMFKELAHVKCTGTVLAL